MYIALPVSLCLTMLSEMKVDFLLLVHDMIECVGYSVCKAAAAPSLRLHLGAGMLLKRSLAIFNTSCRHCIPMAGFAFALCISAESTTELGPFSHRTMRDTRAGCAVEHMRCQQVQKALQHKLPPHAALQRAPWAKQSSSGAGCGTGSC